MSRTYVGPFGRILPLPEGKEPEHQHMPDDETRTSMATYQLPPPDRLQFGSDTSSGFTEPVRYNAISQSSRSRLPGKPAYAEQAQQARLVPHEQLPSVSQLLTPSIQTTASQLPFSSYRGPASSHGSLDYSSEHQGPIPSQDARPSNFTYQPPTYSQPASFSAQTPPRGTVGPAGDTYNMSISTLQHFHPPYVHHQGQSLSSYPPSFEASQLQSYAPQHQQVPLPNFSHHPQNALRYNSQNQQPTPLSVSQPQHELAVSNSTQNYPDQSSKHEAPANSVMSHEQSPQSSVNSTKPLPRVIGETDVPREGPSWIYEDGSTCKKVIDGEEVNAQWGVTKAGKPRKRLAIACTTCREKKIKCDPAEPKCVQCEKFGRECRFTTAFHSHRVSSDSPSYDSQAHTPFMNIKSEAPLGSLETILKQGSSQRRDQKPLKRRKSSPEIHTSTKTLSFGACSEETHLVKRQRSSLPGSITARAVPKIRALKPSHPAPDPRCFKEDEPAGVDVDSFGWRVDPFDADSSTANHYLDAYFTHMNNTTYRMFPAKPFLRWALHSKDKSLEDLMTIHAMLAVGSIFSRRPDRKSVGCVFAEVARYAMEKRQGRFSLQLAHSRLLLAWYHFSLGDAHRSWEFSGMAIRAVSGLKFSLESECQNVKRTEKPEYGLNKYALAECRRRVFWSAYMADRLSGFFSGHSCMLQSEDVYLRLPCREQDYEEQEFVETPYFNNGCIDPQFCQSSDTAKIGTMVLSVQVSSIWSDVLANIFRSSHASDHNYVTDSQCFYDLSTQKLSSWTKTLPPQLACDNEGLRSSILEGNVGALTSVHAIYHVANLKLNRHVRHTLLPTSSIARNVKSAMAHASQLLQLIRNISSTLQEVENIDSRDKTIQLPDHCAFSSPFVGYAIFTAIDVLSASGELDSCADKVTLMEGSLRAFDSLNRFWSSAQAQSMAIRRRIDRLVEAVESKSAQCKKAWRFNKPLDASIGRDQDLFYDTESQEVVLEHIVGGVTGDDILLMD